MDPKQFEVLSRRVGTAATRRGALQVLAGGMAASASPCFDPGGERRRKSRFPKFCRSPTVR